MARILVVDDEVEVCSVLKTLLEFQGYWVVSAINGHDAFLEVEKENVDIILTDVMMPEVDGYEFCRMIKADERFRNIPVVMLTALLSKEDRIKGIEAGAEDFITKPIDQEEVIARIKMLLRMKEANDRLSHAYDTMNSLTGYGENIIKTFNPLEFDFISKISGIVDQIIRKKKGDQDQRPQQVIVGYRGERNYWQWHLYESVFQELQRIPIKGDIHTSLPLKNRKEMKMGFSGSQDMQNPEFLPLVRALHDHSLKIENMVYYLSDTICVIALNYDREVSRYDAAILNNMVGMSEFLQSLSNQIRETEDAFFYMIRSLARAAEVKDDTGRHILRVGEYAAFIAEKLGLSEKFVRTIRQQALLHDVGKIYISETILLKPEKLTGAEMAKMKMHTVYGAKIVGEHSHLRMGCTICLTHHEQWDGTGYPKGMRQDQIPIEGRIVNIADHYDAIRNKRVYKEAFDHATAYRIITKGNERTLPRHFDPQILKIFRENGSRFEDIYERLPG